MPWPARIVAAIGPGWEAYPKIVLGVFLVAGLAMSLNAPLILTQVLTGLFGLLFLALYLWVFVDVLAMEGETWWFVIILFFGPLGFLAYFIWGR